MCRIGGYNLDFSDSFNGKLSSGERIALKKYLCDEIDKLTRPEEIRKECVERICVYVAAIRAIACRDYLSPEDFGFSSGAESHFEDIMNTEKCDGDTFAQSEIRRLFRKARLDWHGPD